MCSKILACWQLLLAHFFNFFTFSLPQTLLFALPISVATERQVTYVVSMARHAFPAFPALVLLGLAQQPAQAFNPARHPPFSAVISKTTTPSLRFPTTRTRLLAKIKKGSNNIDQENDEPSPFFFATSTETNSTTAAGAIGTAAAVGGAVAVSEGGGGIAATGGTITAARTATTAATTAATVGGAATSTTTATTAATTASTVASGTSAAASSSSTATATATAAAGRVAATGGTITAARTATTAATVGGAATTVGSAATTTAATTATTAATTAAASSSTGASAGTSATTLAARGATAVSVAAGNKAGTAAAARAGSTAAAAVGAAATGLETTTLEGTGGLASAMLGSEVVADGASMDALSSVAGDALAGSGGGGVETIADAITADALVGTEDALLGDAAADAAAGLGDAVAGVGDAITVAAGDAGLGVLSMLPSWLVTGGLVALLGELVFAAIALFAVFQAGASKGKEVLSSAVLEEPEIDGKDLQVDTVASVESEIDRVSL